MKYLLLILLVLAGCKTELTAEDKARYQLRLDHMQARSGGTIEPPTLLWAKWPEFQHGGQANCINWTITLNETTALEHPAYVYYDVIPHEYAHMLSCHYRGGTHLRGGDPHDDWWRQTCLNLGGACTEV